MTVIGKGLPRVDGFEKVTGKCVYLDDIDLPGMLYAKILRSPHAHARIRSIDTRDAENIPGVRCVITARDLPPNKFSFVASMADKYVLCPDEVCFVGDEVAAVAADNLWAAEEALGVIKVDYELLPAVFDAEAGLQPDAPLVHTDQSSNLAWESVSSVGDVEAGFAGSDFVFEGRYTSSKVVHACLETRGCLADFTGERLTVWSPSQAPHTLRQEIARTLELPRHKVRVIRTPLGGGFGGRLVMDMKEPVAAILSRKTGFPVKIVNSREEEFTATRTRYPYIVNLKTGVNKQGKILARHIKIIADNGAYNEKGAATLSSISVSSLALYDIPNVLFEAKLVYTNLEYGGAFRGFGNPQVTFAVESQLDEIAIRLGLEPIEIRLRNAVKPYGINAAGIQVTSCGLTECLETVRVKLASTPLPPLTSPNISRATGIAAMVHPGTSSRKYGFNSTDTLIKVSEDGQVTVISPAIEAGQGSTTVIAQIVAEVLGIELDRIVVFNQDTDLIPYDLGAFGSRTTFVCGNAAKNAAEKVRKIILTTAASMLDKPEESLSFIEGQILERVNSQPLTTFSEVASYSVSKLGRAISVSGQYYDEQAAKLVLPRDLHKLMVNFAYAVQAITLDVDSNTGEINVVQVIAAHDLGRTINCTLASGQVEGGIVQGLGYALTEALRFEDGRVLNPNFLDYKVLRAEDVPEINITFIESNDPDGPFGAKGVGEPPLVPTAPAVANALYRATGARIKELPLEPEKVLHVLLNGKE